MTRLEELSMQLRGMALMHGMSADFPIIAEFDTDVQALIAEARREALSEAIEVIKGCQSRGRNREFMLKCVGALKALLPSEVKPEPKSFANIVGKWPGDETDEEIRKMLEEIS